MRWFVGYPTRGFPSYPSTPGKPIKTGAGNPLLSSSFRRYWKYSYIFSTTIGYLYTRGPANIIGAYDDTSGTALTDGATEIEMFADGTIDFLCKIGEDAETGEILIKVNGTTIETIDASATPNAKWYDIYSVKCRAFKRSVSVVSGDLLTVVHPAGTTRAIGLVEGDGAGNTYTYSYEITTVTDGWP